MEVFYFFLLYLRSAFIIEQKWFCCFYNIQNMTDFDYYTNENKAAHNLK